MTVLRRSSILALTLLSTSSLAGDLADAVRRVVPKGVNATVSRSPNPRGIVVKGSAKTHEDVSEFIRAIATIVSTPHGYGRVTERSDDTIRVELFGGGRAKDFPRAAVSDSKTCVGLRTEERRGRISFTFRLDSKPLNSTVY